MNTQSPNLTMLHLFGAGNMPRYLLDNELRNEGALVFITTSSKKSTLERVKALQATGHYTKSTILPEISLFDPKEAQPQVSCKNLISMLCVKPFVFEQTKKFPQNFTSSNAFVVSIMAAVTQERVRQKIQATLAEADDESKNGIKKPLRIMPNLGAESNSGTVGILRSEDFANDSRQEQFIKLLSKSNLVIELKNENDFHWFTAIAGSGPAFCWELIKRLEYLIGHHHQDTSNERIKDTAVDLVSQQCAKEIENHDINLKKIEQIKSFIPSRLNPVVIQPELKCSAEKEINAFIEGARAGALTETEDSQMINTALFSTMIGSSNHYAHKPIELALSKLQKDVKSRGGTTEAGLNVLTNRSSKSRSNQSALLKENELEQTDLVNYENTQPIYENDIKNCILAAIHRSKLM